MWPPWRRTPSRRSLSSHSTFRCSSFKDIQSLLAGDDDNHPFISNNHPAAVFNQVRAATTSFLEPPASTTASEESSSEAADAAEQPILIPGWESAVVIYTTSLRVIRSTFDACREVMTSLSGFRVSIDERDVSMDPRFMDELRSVLGGETANLSLPRVFIGGKHVGGVEEVKQLHEIGELNKMLEGLPLAELGQCGGCGGSRFVVCDECNGSRKVFAEENGEFRTCEKCNRNGLIRCPSCCSLPPIPAAV
ncbi:hypothetical protein Droror1_Dr00003341 [Drosera rotundifolia]